MTLMQSDSYGKKCTRLLIWYLTGLYLSKDRRPWLDPVWKEASFGFLGGLGGDFSVLTGFGHTGLEVAYETDSLRAWDLYKQWAHRWSPKRRRVHTYNLLEENLPFDFVWYDQQQIVSPVLAEEVASIAARQKGPLFAVTFSRGRDESKTPGLRLLCQTARGVVRTDADRQARSLMGLAPSDQVMREWYLTHAANAILEPLAEWIFPIVSIRYAGAGRYPMTSVLYERTTSAASVSDGFFRCRQALPKDLVLAGTKEQLVKLAAIFPREMQPRLMNVEERFMRAWKAHETRRKNRSH